MSDPSSTAASRRPWLSAALVIFLLAFAFRLMGAGWGLKNDLHLHSYHPDEPVVFGYSQQVNPAAGDFTPGFYNYGTLYLTLLKVAGDVTATYTGAPNPREPGSVEAFMSRAHVAGRTLSALAGAGTVVVVFLFGWRYGGPWAAWFGGGLLAVAPGHVVHSRFQTVDVLAAFLLALSLWFAARMVPSEEEPEPPLMKLAVLSGLFAGLSAGTKYTGILALSGLVIVAALTARPQAVKLSAAGIGTGLVAFFLSTPGVLLEREAFLRDFKYEMWHTATGHGTVFLATSPGFVYHLANLMVGFSLIGLVMGAVGLGMAAKQGGKWAWALILFSLLYYVLIGRAEVKFLRYTFPLMIPLAVGFGLVVARAQATGGRMKAVVALGILAIGGLDPGGLRGAAVLTAQMAGEDSRDEAARYLTALPQAATSTVGYASDPWFYSVPLFPLSAAPRFVPARARLQQMSEATSPRPVTFADPVAEPLTPPASFDPRLVTETAPDFIVYSSFESDDLVRIRAAGGTDDPVVKGMIDNYTAFEKVLNERYQLARVFGGDGSHVHDLMYIRPTVYVYQRK